MWGAIKKAINSNLNKSLDVLIQEKATETNGKVDSKASQVSVNNIGAKVDDLVRERVVKSVQCGFATPPQGAKLLTINHNSVNASKSIIILNGGGSNTSVPLPVYISSKTANNFIISPNPNNGTELASFISISWQVIEFY